MHYVYVLRNQHKYYVGYTKNLDQRIEQHEKLHPDFTLVYYEAYVSSRLARERERKLKLYGSAWRGLKRRIEEA